VNDKSDVQLLRDYADRSDEAAFREIVGRYADLVYSAALRQVESSAAASDLAQSVFTDLARKAGNLARASEDTNSLAGWLHRATRYTALNHLRDTRRRHSNERQAMEQLLTNTAFAPDWEQIRPVLDEALDSLGDDDREALLLRYFKNQDFRAVGLALGVRDDTAQKRVSRAVERLREFFTKRNVTIGASGLVVLISANAVQSAPVGLAATISAAAVLAGTAVHTSTIIATTKTIAMTTLQKTFITAALVAGAATTLVIQHQAQAKLRAENQSLRQEIAQLKNDNKSLSNRVAWVKSAPTPHLPAPPMHITASTNAPVEDLQPTNLYARFKDKAPKLTADQVEAYLKANGRKASSLLAAYRTSGDQALLKEAMEKYPNDPQVAFEAALDKNLSPEEQRQWLNTFEKSSPDNALANYLSALNYFNSGQIDQGVQELTAASGKQSLQNYTLDRWKDDEEAYLSAGYSVAEAKFLATSDLPLPQLAPLRQLGQDLVGLANAYAKTGDQASAEATLQMAVNLGQRYVPAAAGQAMICQLVGLAIERMAFSAMDPNSPYGDNGQTVQDQLNLLAQQRTALKELGQQAGSLLETMPDQEWINYIDRWIIFGDSPAAQWLVNKYGQQ
jgi:RNA polymerase sigma factor (sigma-70 family)